MTLRISHRRSSHSLRNIARLLLVPALFAATSAAPLPVASVKVAQAQAAAGGKLEPLLKEAKLAYNEVGKGAYRVFIGDNDATTSVILRETALIPDDADYAIIILFTSVLQMPKEFKPSTAMLKKMAEINDNLLVGKLSLNVGEDSQAVFYNSSLWTKIATADTLRTEIELAHIMKTQFVKQLQPFTKE